MKTYHGNVLTVDAKDTTCQYLVEDKGLIKYVGDELPEKYMDCEQIDLKDAVLVPSFADTHQHFASFSTFQAGLNVMNATSNKQIMEMLKGFAEKKKDKT